MNSAKGRSRRVWSGALAAVLAIVLVFAWPHLRLAATIATAAREEFPQGVEYLGSIHQDHFEAIARHPPSRVAKYLQAPWPQWRAVVCHALASEGWPAEASWSGIPARLAAVALNDPNTFVRQLAQSSLRRALPVVPDETAAPFSQALAASAGADRDEVLRILAEQPTAQEPLRLALLGHRTSTDLANRLIALELLATIAPSDLDEELVTSALRPSEESRSRLASIVQAVILQRPDLATGLLQGSSFQQEWTLRGLRDLQESLDRASYAPPHLQGTQTPSLDSDLIAKANTLALSIVHGSEPSLRQTALDLLMATPNGGHYLVQAAQRSANESVLGALANFTQRAVHRGGFQFTPAESEALFRLLTHADPSIRKSALIAMAPYHDGTAVRDLYPSPSSPGVANHRRLLLELLRDSDGAVACAALVCVNRLLEIDGSEVESVAAAIRRNACQSATHTAYEGLLTRFPRHPRTLEFAKEMVRSEWPWLAEQAEAHLREHVRGK